jgi:hypothetical protein
MPNPIKYSTGSETLSLKKGNFYIGTGDVGKGPSDVTGYYQGVDVPSSGYTIYLYNETAPGNLSYHVANNDEELVSFTNGLSGSGFTSTTQCFNYFVGQNNNILLNQNINPIITDGLILSLQPNLRMSYPLSGNTWYDLSVGNNNTTLINGTQYSGNSGGVFKFDGVDDYVTIPNTVSATTGVTMLFWINKIFTNYYFHMNSRRNSPTDSTQTGIGSTTPVSSNGWCQVGYFWSGNTSYFIFNGNIINSNSGGRFAYDNNSSIVMFSANNNGYFSGNDAPLTNFSLQNSTGGAGGFQWVNRNNKVLGILSSQQNRQPFNGEMGEVFFYDKPLNSSEILQNYEAIGTRYVTFDLQYMVVAGGGGGGTAGYAGGGGGAGGLLTGYTTSLTTNTNYTITIGSGGPEDTNGNNSVFHTVTVIGGGKGGVTNGAGGNGGSGGGGGANYPTSVPNGLTPSGSGTTGQGYDGGVGKSVYGDTRLDGIPTGAGGGGGAGQVGGVGTTSPNLKAGDGGNGLYFSEYTSLGGSPSGWFAGGGGGSTSYSNKQLNGVGLGGQGGGGKGSQTVGNEGQPKADNGVINTGSGGGGGGYNTGSGNPGSGGSGIIILRVPDVYTAKFSSGVSASVTKSGGYKYYKVTATSTTSETVSFS